VSSPRSICLSLEEVVYGIDGKPPNCAEAIDVAKEEAKNEDADRMEIEIRTEARGTATSRQEDAFRVAIGTPTRTIMDQIYKRLQDSPGEAFSGSIRLNFRSTENTHRQYKTHSRTMRAVLDGAGKANGNGDDGAAATAAGVDYVRPMFDMLLRSAEVQIERDKATAQLVSANAQVTAGFAHMLRPADGASPNGNPLLQLLGGAIAANAGTGAGGASKAAAQVAGSLISGGGMPPPSPVPRARVEPPPRPGPYTPPKPPEPGSMVPPVNSSSITRSQVEKWAADNPTEAENLVKNELRKRGFPVA
jgi:hypothetical protein